MIATSAHVAPRETVEAIAPGDAVELAIDSYEWSNPLDVIDADDPVEWDVPLGADWWMRTIYVKGRSATYAVRYDNCGDDDPRVVCHNVEDGELGEVRGHVVHLDRIEQADPGDAHEADTVDPDEVRPDGLTEACIHSVAEHYGTLEEVADDLGVDQERAETILDAHDCLSEVVR